MSNQLSSLAKPVEAAGGESYLDQRGVSYPWLTGRLHEAIISAIYQVASAGDFGVLATRLGIEELRELLLRSQDQQALPRPSAHRPARSNYDRFQVARIAPAELFDRDAELASFCATPATNSFALWQAPAWAGKSALLSWFVLHPPADAEVVSFFITARYKGQNDRSAFIDNVLPQLAQLLGEPMPMFTESTGEIMFLDLLSRAADRCTRQDKQLILVVDGLDEDRGVTTDPYAYSISALLPSRVPDGLKVIASSRPQPPIPPDVPEDHPLRQPGIVRLLDISPHAAVRRADMTREIKRPLACSRSSSSP
ncbi:hypothetical protein [Allorhizocola rhizosphaerae]|uniref:hypothetical protein n=1 Tax=Allorhizocola rhizosphaerae TaxID=1872709 RepID=UPI0013C37108|nr:hypothetical protein [Allorhizocola rhizosphaerae]